MQVVAAIAGPPHRRAVQARGPSSPARKSTPRAWSRYVVAGELGAGCAGTDATVGVSASRGW
jgi:hypothetical protein